MKRKMTLLMMLISTIISAQTVTELIKEVNASNLELILNEFSGEVSTTVAGNTVTLINRISSQNSAAANYAKEKFESYENLVVDAIDYSTNGTNIIATQTGMTNPNDVYIICAHYDAVADYCANDNATGVAAILEIAKVLSTYCTDNTIIYALFDEEEDGLLGSANFVSHATSMNLNILGVVNIDMIGYDANQADDAPIHVQDIDNSLAFKDDAVAVLSLYSEEIGLIPTVVNPGIDLSDHKSFWDEGITAIMVTDPVDFSEISPFYHTSGDRVSTLDLPYFYKMTKFLMGIIATNAGLIDNAACDLLSIEENGLFNNIALFPNPTSEAFIIRFQNEPIKAVIHLMDSSGRTVRKYDVDKKNPSIYIADLETGIYLVRIQHNENDIVIKKVVVF